MKDAESNHLVPPIQARAVHDPPYMAPRDGMSTWCRACKDVDEGIRGRKSAADMRLGIRISGKRKPRTGKSCGGNAILDGDPDRRLPVQVQPGRGTTVPLARRT